jgi:hypothetical protein
MLIGAVAGLLPALRAASPRYSQLSPDTPTASRAPLGFPGEFGGARLAYGNKFD